MSKTIKYGEERLYCPVCKSVMIRNENKEYNFRCVKCRADWVIVDSKGFYVLSPQMGGLGGEREAITEAELKEATKK